MQITRVSSWDHSRTEPKNNLEREIGMCMPTKLPIRKRLIIEGIAVNDEASRIDVAEQLTWETADVTLSGLTRLIDMGLQAITLGRRKHNGKGKREAADFEAVPQDVLSLDIDGMPFLEGFTRDDLLADPERVIRAHVEALLGDGVRGEWLVVLSSSCGFEAKGKPVLRFHLHIALDRDYPPHILEMKVQEAKARLPFVDAVTTVPSQLLFTSRPLLNVPDPFPRRVFLNASALRQPLDAKAETYVASTLPASRGRSSALYRISSDRFTAREFISEEVRNFTLSLRNSFPAMEWPEAKGYVERAMQDAGATDYHFQRMSAKGEHLGEARRLFERAPIDGAKSVYAEPAYVEPEGSADVAAHRLAAIVNAITAGQHLFRVSTGTGKTDLVAHYAARNPHKKVVILTTNHERCAELRKRLERAREIEMCKIEQFDWPSMEEQRESNLFKPWDVWEGRLHDDACLRPEAVKAVQRAHLSPHKHLCGYGEDIQCPMMGTCRHSSKMLSQWAYNWIAPVAMVGAKSQIIKDADVLIIDEGVVGYLIGEHHFDLSQLLTPRGDRLDDLSRRAYLGLLQGERPLTAADVSEALDLERGRHPSVHADGLMTDEEVIKATDMTGYFPKLVSLWRAMLAEFDGAQNAVHTYERQEEVDGDLVTRFMCRTAWRKSVDLKSDALMIFDATPNEIALTAHFPDIAVHRFDAKVQNCHVVQVVNNKGVKAEYLNVIPKPADDSKADEKDAWTKFEKRKATKRAGLAKWLKALPGRTVVICKKEMRGLMESEHRLPNVAWGHLGGIEGQDVWEIAGVDVKGAEIDNLVLIGRNLPQPYVLEAIARQHHFDEQKIRVIEKPEKGFAWYHDEYKEIMPGVAGVRPVHPDPRVNAVAESIWKHTLEQAFGRGRGTRRDKRLRVFICHNMPLDVTVHEAVTATELSARCGDVTLLSPKEVERVFGYSGRGVEDLGVEVTHRYRVKPGREQPKPYRCRVAEGTDVDAAMKAIGAVWWEPIVRAGE